MTNVPALRDNLPATRLPDVTGTALEGSPHLHLIYHMLCSNWSPWRVALELKRKHGAEYAPEDIDAFLQRIDDADLMPTTSLMRHLRGMNIITDTWAELHALARYSRERLEHAIEIEQADGKGISQKVETALSQHWKRVMELRAIEEARGEAVFDDDERPSDDTPTLGDLFRMDSNKKITLRRDSVTIEDVDATHPRRPTVDPREDSGTLLTGPAEEDGPF
jgi:hypothetical protein